MSSALDGDGDGECVASLPNGEYVTIPRRFQAVSQNSTPDVHEPLAVDGQGGLRAKRDGLAEQAPPLQRGDKTRGVAEMGRSVLRPYEEFFREL
jgi:hypothetical protein